MEITRDVILDLMPLYVADELSADSRALVERYLETEPELADVARQSAAELAENMPIPLTMEDRMEAHKEAKRFLYRRTLVWAAVIAVALLGLLGMGVMAFMFLVRAGFP